MGEIIDKTRGKIKQAVGDLTGNKRLKREGGRDEHKAKAKRAVKNAKDAVNGRIRNWHRCSTK